MPYAKYIGDRFYANSSGDLPISAKVMDGAYATTYNEKKNYIKISGYWQQVVAEPEDGLNGSGTTNYITKWTDTDTLGDSQIIDNGTNVGVGMTPSYKFDVSGTIRTSNQFISTLSTGTSPLVVSSTTLVSNLNVDLLDNQEGSYYLDYNNFVNTPTIGDGLITIAAGTGLSGGGTFNLNDVGNTTITLNSTDVGSSQNIFKNIAVTGQSTIVADSNNDTLTFAGGLGITLTTNATTDTLTITNSGVLSNVAGTGISVSSATGDVTITNTDRGSSQNIFKNIAVSTQSTIVADSNNDTLTVAAGSGMTITTNATTDTLTITNNDRGSSQNIFKTIAVSGQSSIVADSNADTLTLVAGNGITLTTNATTDSLTITSDVGGSGTTNYVSKWSDSNTLTDSQIFDNGTNVGINNITPSYRLDVNGTLRATGAVHFTGLNVGSDNTVLVVNSSGEVVTDEIDNRVWGNTLVDGSGSANKIAFWMDANTLSYDSILHFDSSTNHLGINNTSPEAPLHIESASTTDGELFQIWTLSGNASSAYNLSLKQDVTVGIIKYIFDLTNNSTAYSNNLVLDRGKVGVGTDSPDESIHTTNNVKVDGRVLVSDGTNSAPAYTFCTDDNTGIYRSASDVIAFANVGVLRHTFGNGYHTILNTNSNTTDQAVGSTTKGLRTDSGEGFAIYGNTNFFGANADAIIFQMEDSNGANGNTDGGLVFRSYTPTDGVARNWMVIKTGGLVGINTTSPSASLDVVGTVEISSTVTLNGVAAGTDNTVLLLNSGNQVIQDEIDSRVFGNTLVDGSGTTNYVSKWSDSDTLTDSQIIDDGTNVGVGMSPTYKLDVDGVIRGLSFRGDSIQGETHAANSFLDFDDDQTGFTNGTTLASIAGLYLIFDSDNNDTNDFRISSGSTDMDLVTTHFIIDNTGAVGIGTTNPDGYKVNINGSLKTASDVNVGGSITAVQSITASGTITFTGLSSGTDDTVIIQNGSGSLQTREISPKVWTGMVDGSGTVNYVSKWSNTTELTDSQIFDNGTNVGINDPTPSYKLDVNGTGRFTGNFYADSDVVIGGNLTVNGTTTVLNTTVEVETSVVEENFIITSTDAGATDGPDFILYRDSSTPADNDLIGNIRFRGNQNGNANAVEYAQISTLVQDADNGTGTDGLLRLSVVSGGSLTSNALTVSGVNNGYVGINTASPDAPLHVSHNIGAIIGDYHLYGDSVYSFSNGILIATSINATGDNRMFELTIEGNSYGLSSTVGPIFSRVQGYNYLTSGTILNTSAISNDPNFTIDVFHYNGYVYFWFAQTTLYQTYTFKLISPNGIEKITGISNAAKPTTGVTNNVSITPYKIWTSVNDGSGSGLDADKLDNLDSSQFLRSDANDTGTGDYIFSGVITLTGTTASTDNTVLILDGSNRIKTDEIDGRVWGNTLVDSAGTANYIPKFTDANSLENSIMYETASKIGVNDTSPDKTFDINGSLKVGDNTAYGQVAVDTAGAVPSGYDGSIEIAPWTTDVAATKHHSTRFVNKTDGGTTIHDVIVEGSIGAGDLFMDAGPLSYNLEVEGTVGFSEYIYHRDDPDNYIRFQTTQIDICGDQSVFTFSPSGLTHDGASTYDLGDATNRWENLYAGSIYANGTIEFSNLNTSSETRFVVASSAGVLSYRTTLPAGSVTGLEIFKNIAVSGQTTISADSTADTLTIIAGSGISITTNATTDTLTITNSGVLSVNGVTGAVTAANLLTAIKTVDGAGSGLDADLLDGRTSGQFLRTNGTGATTIDVNSALETYLYVGSTSTWANRGPSGNNAGALLTINTYAGDYYSQLWFDTSGNNFYLRNASNTLPTGSWQKIWHDGNDGASSGLDADLLDGQHGSYYLDTSSTGQTKTGTLTLDPSAGVALTIDRVSGSASIKAGANDGHLVLDSNGGYVSLNHYTTDDVVLCYGGGFVGIGTVNPAYKLHVAGSGYFSSDVDIVGNLDSVQSITATGTMTFSGIATGTDDTVIIQNASGVLQKREIDSRVWGSSLVDGSGTANYIAKWSDSNTVTNSLIFDNGTNVGIGTSSPEDKLHIQISTNNEIGFHTAETSVITDVVTHGPAIRFSRPSDGSNNIAGIFSYQSGSGTNLAISTGTDIVFACGGGSTYGNSPERLRLSDSGHLIPYVDSSQDLGTTSKRWRYGYVDDIIATNNILVGDGSAASPSFSFNSDINTGLYRTGTDAIGISLAGTLEWEYTATGLHSRDRNNFITFYNDTSLSHAIGSRDIAGNAADDIRINSYGSVIVNLDSNSDNGSGADFIIGKHGLGTGTASEIFRIDGEDGSIIMQDGAHIHYPYDNYVHFTDTFMADSTQARKAPLMQVSYNTHNWNSAGNIIIEVFSQYPNNDSYQKWLLTTDRLATAGSGSTTGDTTDANSQDYVLRLIEARGTACNNFKLVMEQPVDTGINDSGGWDIFAAQVYLYVDNYIRVRAKITVNSQRTFLEWGSTFSSDNQYKVQTGPTYTNVSTFYNTSDSVSEGIYTPILYGADEAFDKSYSSSLAAIRNYYIAPAAAGTSINVNGKSVLKNVEPASGSTYDLGASGNTWANIYVDNIISSGGVTLSGFTQGSVVFAGASGALTEDNTNFFWDDANNRLGVRTSSPSYDLDVNGSGRFTSNLYLGQYLYHDGDLDTYLDFDAANSFRVVVGSQEAIRFNTSETVINENSIDRDFRVETDNLNYTLMVDGSTDRVGIKKLDPAYDLDVAGTFRNTGFRDLGIAKILLNGSATSAGWYPIGHWGGSRGGHRIYISYTGGSWTPETYEIEVFKNWTTGVGIRTKQFTSVSYITDVRVVGNTGDATYYLEVYCSANANGHNMYIYHENIGYHDGDFELESSLAISTNSGTVLAQQDFYQYSTIDTNFGVADRIFHDGDTDTYFQFHQLDGIRLVTNDIERFAVNNSEIVVNETGASTDFRVESDTLTHMLFVDGSANTIGINNSSPTYTLHVTGTGYFSSNLTTAGDFTETSSLKYKENILPYSVKIDRFDALKPVQYTRKSDGEQDLGFIAEEMHELMPEFVGYKDGEPDSIKYSKMVTMLVNVLQETREELKEVKKEIAELKKQKNLLEKIKGIFKK